LKAHLLGLEIGGTKLQLVAGNEEGKVLERLRLTVEPARGGAGIRRQIKAALPKLLRRYKVGAIGVGFGGPVDWPAGRIARSHQIEGWSGFELTAWLKELARVPVVADNDANVAALGEALHGAGVGYEPVFYVTLGSGVGGGLVTQGQVYHGAVPGEAEIGHLRLDRQGTLLESLCSGWAIDARVREVAAANKTSILARLAGGKQSGEAKFLAPALAQGDASAKRILKKLAEDLCLGLSHVAHLFHPQVVILGGGLSGVGEPLRTAVAHELPACLMEVFRPGPNVVLAALAEDAVPVGALELARRAVIASSRRRR
jgi:glucokinase